jgi:hypothetical protein
MAENHPDDHDGGVEAFNDGYPLGYADGLRDAVFELLWPAVARAARLSDADALRYALGRAIAVGEARQQAPPMPTNGKEH